MCCHLPITVEKKKQKEKKKEKQKKKRKKQKKKQRRWRLQSCGYLIFAGASGSLQFDRREDSELMRRQEE